MRCNGECDDHHYNNVVILETRDVQFMDTRIALNYSRGLGIADLFTFCQSELRISSHSPKLTHQALHDQSTRRAPKIEMVPIHPHALNPTLPPAHLQPETQADSSKQSLPATYKPSPLSYGSPRTSPFKRPESPASPFRRPESPSSPSTLNRPLTPTPTSPTKLPQQQTPHTSPSKLHNASTPPSATGSWTPRGLVTPSLPTREEGKGEERSLSPTRTGSSSLVTTIATNKPPYTTAGNKAPMGAANGDALSRLPVAQVREMREGFQILDRDNDGLVNREDVVDMLTNLGACPNTTLPLPPTRR